MTTVYKGISVPDLTDPPNAPQQFRTLVDSGGAVPRFATIGDANAAFPPGSRPAGMIVAVGTQFYVSDGTNFVASMVSGIPIFADAAARAAALPSPAKGARSALADNPRVAWVYDGTAWRGVDQVSGRALITTNASGGFTITYPRALIAAPGSVVIIGSGSSTVFRVVAVIDAQRTAADVGGVVRDIGGTVTASQTLAVYYIATAEV